MTSEQNLAREALEQMERICQRFERDREQGYKGRDAAYVLEMMKPYRAALNQSAEPVGVKRYGMIDEASGYDPLYFGETTDLPPHAIRGPQYVRLECAKVAACDCCDVCGESPGYPKCANVIADEIRALGKGEG